MNEDFNKEEEIDKDSAGYKVGEMMVYVFAACVSAVAIVGTIKILTWLWWL